MLFVLEILPWGRHFFFYYRGEELEANRSDPAGSPVESGRSRTETKHVAPRPMSSHRETEGSTIPGTETEEWSPSPLLSSHATSTPRGIDSISATYTHFWKFLAIEMKDTSDYVTSMLTPPPGKSVSLTAKAEALTLASDVCACLLSPSTLPTPLPFLSPSVSCSSHTGLFASGSQANQEHSHLRLLHWLFPPCFPSTFFKSWLTCNFLMTLPLITLFKIAARIPTLSGVPIDSFILLYCLYFRSTCAIFELSTEWTCP